MLRKGKNKHLCNFSCFLSKQLFCDCTHRNNNSMLLTIAFAVEIDCGVTVVRIWNGEREPCAGEVGMSCRDGQKPSKGLADACGCHRWADPMVIK